MLCCVCYINVACLILTEHRTTREASCLTASALVLLFGKTTVIALIDFSCFFITVNHLNNLNTYYATSVMTVLAC